MKHSQAVVAALREFSPSRAKAVLSRRSDKRTIAIRRVAMAASRNMGETLTSVGQTFDRDHKTVHTHCQMFRDTLVSGREGVDGQASLFLFLIRKARSIQQARSSA